MMSLNSAARPPSRTISGTGTMMIADGIAPGFPEFAGDCG
jgi:hypothetical protein